LRPKTWVPEVRQFFPNAPVILADNRKDLRNDETPQRQGYPSSVKQEPVKREEGSLIRERKTPSSVLQQENVFETAEKATFENKKMK